MPWQATLLPYALSTTHLIPALRQAAISVYQALLECGCSDHCGNDFILLH
jgi:hypothetical protein